MFFFIPFILQKNIIRNDNNSNGGKKHLQFVEQQILKIENSFYLDFKLDISHFFSNILNMSQISESSESFVKLKENLRLYDIDLPLFKYEIINRETFDVLLSNGDNKRNKGYKTYSLIALMLFNIIRYITYMFISNNGRVPKSYLDLCQ